MAPRARRGLALLRSSIFLIVPTVLSCIGLVVGYLVKVIGPKYGRRCSIDAGVAVTDAIAWDLAEQVAGRVAGRDPFADSYLYESLAARLRRVDGRGRGARHGRDRLVP